MGLATLILAAGAVALVALVIVGIWTLKRTRAASRIYRDDN